MNETNLGQLGIPVTPSYNLSYMRTHYSDWLDAIKRHVENDSLLLELKSQLEEDSRLTPFLSDGIQVGGDFLISVVLENVLVWWTVRANRKGVDQANTELNTFLETDEYACRASLWVFGPSPSQPIELPNDVTFVSWADSYDDSDKYNFRYEYQGATKPSGVLYKDFRIKKSSTLDDTKNIRSEINQELNEVSLVINCLDTVHSVNGPRFGRLAPVTPGSGFVQTHQSSQHISVQAMGEVKLDAAAGQQLCRLVEAFGNINNNRKWKDQLQAAIHRLSTAKRHYDLNSIALDLGIALEMVLLFDAHGNDRPDQLSLTFRLRGAWLLGDSFQERERVFKELNKIYQKRSQVAHTGGLKQSKDLPAEIHSHVRLAESIFKKLILLGTGPKWSKLILGGCSVAEI